MKKAFEGKVAVILALVIASTFSCSPTLTRYSSQSRLPQIKDVIQEEFVRYFLCQSFADSSRYIFDHSFPGPAFSPGELGFSGMPDIFSSHEALNGAYRFSKLTDRVYIIDSANCVTAASLQTILLDREIIDGDIDLVFSPAYNDTFFPVYPNPVLSDTAGLWTDFRITGMKTDTIRRGRKSVFVELPLFSIEFSAVRIDILRNNIAAGLSGHGNLTAIISSIVLLDRLSVQISDFDITIRRKKAAATAIPVSSTYTEGPQIAGYIFKIH